MNQPQAVFDFDAIELAFGYANFDGRANEAYLDRRTGEVLYFSTFGDSDEEPDDIDDTSRYVALPHAHDMGLGSRLAVEFASDTAPHLVDDVRNAFGGRGGFRRFKNLLDKHGLLDAWHAYEAERERTALIRWCDENDVHYTITKVQGGR